MNHSVKLLSVLLAVLMLFSAAGCREDAKEVTAAPSEMTAKVMEAIDFPEMLDVETDIVKELYFIDPDTVEDLSVYMASDGVSADEIAVIRVKDASSAEAIEKACHDRIDYQSAMLEDYAPDEMTKLEKAKVITHGCYVFMIVSNDADAGVKAFESFF